MSLPDELNTIEASVLLTTFQCRRKSVKVFFHNNRIVWDRVKPPFAQTSVPVENIVAVRHTNKKGSLFDPDIHQEINPNSFIIHYVRFGSNNCLKYCNVVFTHKDPLQVHSWVKTLQNYLQKLNRPQTLLLFVNPFGGRKRGIKIFQKICKPLFEIAGLDVTAIISNRKNQIRDYILENNIDAYDGITCVGGDGTVSEVFNGLVMRECIEKQLDIDDVNVELPKPRIPIGIIPGHNFGMDLVTVHDQRKLVRLYASVLSYGYLGDVIALSDKYRWLGPRRYDYSGLKTVIANRGYEGEIAIRSRDLSASQTKCYANCQECNEYMSDNDNSNELKWHKLKGKFFMISGANISCSCSRSPNGIAPFCHLGNGQLHMVIVYHTSLLNNLRLLLRLTERNRDLAEFSFVKIRQGTEFCFRPLNVRSNWNCDGELQGEAEIRAKYD